jgi:hypothetical protein
LLNGTSGVELQGMQETVKHAERERERERVQDHKNTGHKEREIAQGRHKREKCRTERKNDRNVKKERQNERNKVQDARKQGWIKEEKKI